MTVAAPPRPPQVNESTGHDPGEALIKEAKQRARRRKWIYGGVATAVAIAAVAAFTIPTSSTPPPNDATPHIPAPPAVPLGAPLVVGPNAASTLLTSYGVIHFGYVFVYADGRVIWHPALGISVNAAGRPVDYPLLLPNDDEHVDTSLWHVSDIERRLNQPGLDLVRAGRIVPTDLLSSILSPRDASPYYPVPAPRRDTRNLWAEPIPTIYEPSHYAVCFMHPTGPLAATQGAAQLPATAQALLHGTEKHIYDPKIGAPWSLAQTPEECFTLTGAERTTLLQMFNYKDMWPNSADACDGPCTKFRGQSENGVQLGGVNHYMSVSAIYPHGQYVHWGG